MREPGAKYHGVPTGLKDESFVNAEQMGAFAGEALYGGRAS